MSALRVLDPVDPRLLRLGSRELLHELAAPTLLHVPAGAPGVPSDEVDLRPRAVVVLQHGDEHTGLDALLEVLSDGRPLPYDLHVLVGNVPAALAPPGFAHRMLPHQSDMNRAWYGPDEPGGGHDDASVAARAALVHLRALAPAALVDLHNTTGENPAHAIVAEDTPSALGLAALFTPLVVHFDQRLHTLLEALRGHCTAVTVECGRVGTAAAHAFAVDGLQRFLDAPRPTALPVPSGLRPLRRMRRVIVDPTATLAFGGIDADDGRLAADIVVAADAEARNGVAQPPGWLLATVRPGHERALRVIDTDGSDVSSTLLDVARGEVRVRVPTTPLMMTGSVAAARADCLTYLLDPDA